MDKPVPKLRIITIEEPLWTRPRSVGIAKDQSEPGFIIKIAYKRRSGPNKGQLLFPSAYYMSMKKFNALPVMGKDESKISGLKRVYFEDLPKVPDDKLKEIEALWQE